jgi:hypothetical protein
MPERLAVRAISSVHPDADGEVVHIEYETSDKPDQLDIHAGALSTLLLGLRQAAQAFPVSSAEFTGQPLELTGAGLVSLEDGRLMLELVLDGMLRVLVDVPDLAIVSLHECLFAMHEVRNAEAEAPTPPTHH